METFRNCISAAYDIMQTPIVVLDYPVTFWQLFIFFAIAGCLLRLFYGMMD